jgi:hypothetical protein
MWRHSSILEVLISMQRSSVTLARVKWEALDYRESARRT